MTFRRPVADGRSSLTRRASRQASCRAGTAPVTMGRLTVWQAWGRDRTAGPGDDDGDQPTPDDVVATTFGRGSDYRQANTGNDIPITDARRGSRLCIPGRVVARVVQGSDGTGGGLDLVTPCLSR